MKIRRLHTFNAQSRLFILMYILSKTWKPFEHRSEICIPNSNLSLLSCAQLLYSIIKYYVVLLHFIHSQFMAIDRVSFVPLDCHLLVIIQKLKDVCQNRTVQCAFLFLIEWDMSPQMMMACRRYKENEVSGISRWEKYGNPLVAM